MDGVELSELGKFLEGKARNVYSQFGEDGLIEAALDEFGTVNRWCFEVGAADGVFFSNTLRLREEGWSAVLIEGDKPLFEGLCRFKSDKVHCVNEVIGTDSLDAILERHGAPRNMDFGCIDIDGQDFWVWDGMQKFRPRLMLVEHAYGDDDKPEFVPEIGGQGQANRKGVERLAREKGYQLLARTHCNLLFVTEETLWTKSS